MPLRVQKLHKRLMQLFIVTSQWRIPTLYHTAEQSFMIVVGSCIVFTALMVLQVYLLGPAAFKLFSTQVDWLAGSARPVFWSY